MSRLSLSQAFLFPLTYITGSHIRISMFISYVICLFTLTLAMVMVMVAAGVEVPQNGNFAFCFTVDCMVETLAAAKRDGVLVVAQFTPDIATDGYMALYAGVLAEMFKGLGMPILMAIYQFDVLDTEISISRALAAMPRKSVLVCMQHGKSVFSLKTLSYYRQEHHYGPAIIVHLNHEQPWITHDPKALDYIYGSVEEIVEGYRPFDLVLRNYYYQPLTATSVYLPLRAPYFGNMIGNASSPVYQAQSQPVHTRSHWCDVVGRTKYDQIKRANHVLDILHHFEHTKERIHLLELVHRGNAGGCTFAEHNMDLTKHTTEEMGKGRMPYEEYIVRLADTVFVPCPSGNNPETFRIYEVLEVGAIPLIVKPPKDKNYMNFGLWQEYPGPIFDSWDDLEPFMASMTTDYASLLQSQIISWFDRFKQDTSQFIAEKMREVFDRYDREDGAALKATIASEIDTDGINYSEGSYQNISEEAATVEALVANSEGQAPSEDLAGRVVRLEEAMVQVVAVVNALVQQIQALQEQLANKQ